MTGTDTLRIRTEAAKAIETIKGIVKTCQHLDPGCDHLNLFRRQANLRRMNDELVSAFVDVQEAIGLAGADEGPGAHRNELLDRHVDAFDDVFAAAWQHVENVALAEDEPEASHADRAYQQAQERRVA
ncbi:hypothetical protein [Consotaella aegiceratis]|uniref:hypothetical protein n=1 Tax=Consotaella aegiceratis TaxID=3097961 RepID=UPI002F42A267